MIDLGGRNADHAATGQTSSLGEVESGGDRGQKLVDPFQSLSQVASDEHRGRSHESDLAHHVVLLLVDLAFVESRVRLTKHVGRAPHRLEFVLGAGNEQFRASEGCLIPLHLMHQCRESVRSRPRVGVKDPQEVDVFPLCRDGVFQSLVCLNVLGDVLPITNHHHHHRRSGLVHLPIHGGASCIQVCPCHKSEEHLDSRRAKTLFGCVCFRDSRSWGVGHAGCHCEPARNSEQYREE